MTTTRTGSMTRPAIGMKECLATHEYVDYQQTIDDRLATVADHFPTCFAWLSRAEVDLVEQ